MSGACGPASDSFDATLLRRVFGSFPTGVTVVTVGGGTPHGMTANSFASVSLDPPLVLVCVDVGAVMHEALSAGGCFGVSVLGARQERVARHFADRWRPTGQAQFDGVDWVPGRLTGTPLIAGAVARFECELWRSYDGGDHTIFLGRLLSLDHSGYQDALMFFHGRLRPIDAERSEMTA
jgi:flavin reductase (DIM6/NTAB) family NADH-FMN oxidoreductase RutF